MPIIKVENLSKKYILSHQQREAYTALRDVIANKFKAAGRKVLHPFTLHNSQFTNGSHEEFWALKDVSFEIEQGDRVGIIGRNGAGKSTLLKILSRITEPTSGIVGINGRVASLLEVGTGFHPELTGRENIFLNGAILGMSKAEIKRKFDEIVAFAEVEKFLDTPVKHYSSGMYVRLAFAVAAHLEPEILVVDEVLAVGDAQFQKKCLGKMENVGNEGHTIFFVSHNMEAISRLCTRAFLLNAGKLLIDGVPSDAIRGYLASSRKRAGQVVWAETHSAPGDDVAKLRAVRFIGDDDSVITTLDIQRPLKVSINVENLKPGTKLVPHLQFSNDNGVILFTTAFNNDANSKELPVGLLEITCTIPGNFFAEGDISLTVSVNTYAPVLKAHLCEYDVLTLSVEQTGGVKGIFPFDWPGVVRPEFTWECQTS